MNTPIYDFAKAYCESSPLRLHMPGHKGVSRLGCEGLDITEFDGADSLYHADGIILESENNATGLFGSAHTFYSAEGSSLSIRAMLYLIKRHAEDNNKQVRILAARNAHKTFITGCALLGIDVQWIFPDSHGSYLSCRVSAEELVKRLSREYFTAVYITSPDYLGNIADVEAIGKVCDKHGVLLAVDNAHGAYLKFLTPSRHPLDLGAHLCCDSAHKTLPVLTGGAYLHISKKAPESFLSEARDALYLFGSTSPSYLILQSLDLANKYISEGYAEKLIHTAERVKKLKSALSSMGFELMGDEKLKLTVCPKSFGYTGEELAKVLLERGAVCEFCDPDATVMMFTPDTSDGDIDRLCGIFAGIEKRSPITSRPPEMKPPRAVLSPSEVLFADREVLPVCECAGRLLASASVSCPPAVPIVSCGEEINDEAIKMFEYYGIKSCAVVKKQIHGE